MRFKSTILAVLFLILVFTSCTIDNKDDAAGTFTQNNTENSTENNTENNAENKEFTMQSPYWVENNSKLISNNEIAFEDNEGIYTPLLSHDGKSIIYSNGKSELFLYNLSNRERKVIYELKGSDDFDFRVYAVGWSPDDKKVALITSQSGGFIGGNELITVDLESSKSSVVTTKISSADWGKDGNFVIADSSNVKIINEIGREDKTLTTPEGQAVFSADNPTFSPDGKYVVYNCGETYYLHDIEKDEYKKIFEVRTSEGPARISGDGKIIVSDDNDIYIYNIKDETYEVYFDKADANYPNW